MTPTKEQQTIIDALPKRRMMKVNAVAGSGKTSLLVMLAESTRRSGLYLAFNKAMAEEARGKFQSRIECRTTHALAFRALRVGQTYGHKLNRPTGGPRVNRGWFANEIAELLYLPQVGNITPEAMAQAVKKTVQRFQQSADEELGVQHTVLPASFAGLGDFLRENDPAYSMMSDGERRERLAAELRDYERRVREVLAKAGAHLWALRVDQKSPVAIDHDTYLKLFSLSRPNLRQDMIYLDEAQDTNDCVLDLLLLQAEEHGAQLVLVGDRRQAIYQWRGSINAMAKVECDEYPLSQSWRYGPAVAEVAQAILDHDMIVRGNPALDTEIGQVGKRYTWLFRTNAALLEAALPMLAAGRPVALEIDVKPFARRLDSAYHLHEGNLAGVRDELIREYGDWRVLVRESEEDPEMKRIVKLIENDPDSVPVKVEMLERYQRPRKPEVVMCTAHRSKGLQFTEVKLGDDFPSPFDKEGNWTGLAEGEQNLLYVAATRATQVLEINQTVRQILDHDKTTVVEADFAEVEP